MQKSIISKIRKAPQSPGVYIFVNQKRAIYVGKANNLRSRLLSYLRVTDPKIAAIQKESTRLKVIKSDSTVEALVTEAGLIKQLAPKLNFYWRDDKNYFFVVFTKDQFPRLLVTHQAQKWPARHVIGPFTDGRALRLALKRIRRHFPYCTCIQPHLRHCLNSQIGFCLGYCCQKNLPTDDRKLADYRKHIKEIREILSGRRPKILKKIFANNESWAAENILEHRNILSDGHWRRIECFDISNFAGKEAVGAMTVLSYRNGQWQTDQSQFRKFRIENKNTRDDPAMIAEIVRRRLNHLEWTLPDLIVIDGGITQYQAAQKIVTDQSEKIPLISFAKPQEKIIGLEALDPKVRERIKQLADEQIIARAINQTHRFVINYHRQLRDKYGTIDLCKQ